MSAGMVGRGLVVTMVAVLALPRTLPAQVGLTSSPGQVALVAHVAPRASIQSVGPVVETARQGLLKEASVSVRFATNTGYRLVVLAGAAGNGSRVWVRTANGEYRELIPGASVIVARGTHSSGESDRQVRYRIESAADVIELPVRYEIVVDATI